MAYCTDSDVEALLDSGYLGRGIEDDFSAQIAVAQDLFVDPYLEAAGVTTPLSAVPKFIRQATAQFTCYILVNRANSAGQFTDAVAEYKANGQRAVADYLEGRAQTEDAAAPKTDNAVPMTVNRDDLLDPAVAPW